MTAIGLSHGGTTTYTGSSPARRLLVGTAGGVFTLERAGAGGDWTVADRALPDRHVSAIIFPAPDLVVAGAFHDTVYLSRDGGRTWDRRGDGIEPANVYSLASVPRHGGLWLYAGAEPAHLFRSDDLGGRWTELPALRTVPSVPRWMFPAPPHDAHVKHIVPDPQDTSVLYACIEQGALLRSRDGGESWEDLHGGFDEDVHFLVIDPYNPKRMYMTGGNGCYSTTDGGVTWEHRTTSTDPVGAYPDTLVLLPRDPDVMFMGAALGAPQVWRKTHRADARVCRTRDAGRTWELLAGFPRDMAAAIEAMAIEDRGDTVSVYVGTTAGDVYASEDGGEAWEQIAADLPAIAKYGHDRALLGL